MSYALLADLVLVLHVLFVFFVVIAVPLILLGGVRRWRWVRLPWLRGLHLAGICVVAAQSWLGIVCPLTTLEMWLRRQGGSTTYSGNFIEFWLQKLLYWDLPAWVFVTIYTSFALLVLSTWFLVPPRRTMSDDLVSG